MTTHTKETLTITIRGVFGGYIVTRNGSMEHVATSPEEVSQIVQGFLLGQTYNTDLNITGTDLNNTGADFNASMNVDITEKKLYA